MGLLYEMGPPDADVSGPPVEEEGTLDARPAEANEDQLDPYDEWG